MYWINKENKYFRKAEEPLIVGVAGVNISKIETGHKRIRSEQNLLRHMEGCGFYKQIQIKKQ